FFSFGKKEPNLKKLQLNNNFLKFCVRWKMTTVQQSSKKQHRLNDGEHSQPFKKQKRPNDSIAQVLSSNEKRISSDLPKPRRKKLYRPLNGGRDATIIEREEYRLRKMISELKKENTRLGNLLLQASNDGISEVLSSSEKRIALDPKPKCKKLYRRLNGIREATII